MRYFKLKNYTGAVSFKLVIYVVSNDLTSTTCYGSWGVINKYKWKRRDWNNWIKSGFVEEITEEEAALLI